jgi:hypothetical protein
MGSMGWGGAGVRGGGGDPWKGSMGVMVMDARRGKSVFQNLFLVYVFYQSNRQAACQSPYSISDLVVLYASAWLYVDKFQEYVKSECQTQEQPDRACIILLVDMHQAPWRNCDDFHPAAPLSMTRK